LYAEVPLNVSASAVALALASCLDSSKSAGRELATAICVSAKNERIVARIMIAILKAEGKSVSFTDRWIE
jgi:hypothetical protein